jgi:hypothetical protein
VPIDNPVEADVLFGRKYGTAIFFSHDVFPECRSLTYLCLSCFWIIFT